MDARVSLAYKDMERNLSSDMAVFSFASCWAVWTISWAQSSSLWQVAGVMHPRPHEPQTTSCVSARRATMTTRREL